MHVTKIYMDFVLSIGPQIVTSVGNNLYKQFPPVLTRICGHATMIIRGTRIIYSLQLLVHFPSLLNKFRGMKYKIILHM